MYSAYDKPAKMVVESHRPYFFDTMTYYDTNIDYYSIRWSMIPIIIAVINHLKPTMPVEQFAEELGLFLLNILLDEDDKRITPLSKAEQHAFVNGHDAGYFMTIFRKFLTYSHYLVE